jgi:hypothetical protein
LDYAWLQEKEEVEARKIDGRSSGSYDYSLKQNFPGIFFQMQGMYGRPRNPGSRSSAPSKSPYKNSSGTGLSVKMELIDLGTLVCATTASQRTISSETVKNLKLFHET